MKSLLLFLAASATTVHPWAFTGSSFAVRRSASTRLPPHVGLVRTSAAPIVGEKQPGLGVILVGTPAAGKGTQSARISDRYGFVHVAVDDLVRSALALKMGGREAKQFLDAGNQAPDDFVVSIVAKKLASAPCQTRGWLLDGFPRTLAQAEALAAAGVAPGRVISLDLPDSQVAGRVSGRRRDPLTGFIYHLDTDPPLDAEVAARVMSRSDDKAELVAARVAQYRSHAQAVRSFYGDIATPLDGTWSRNDVFEAVRDSIDAALDVKHGVVKVATTPIEGMKMGTSGLRKKCSVFAGNERYLCNFVQSIFDALPRSQVRGGTLVLGGDGRHLNREALQVIIRIAAANGVARVWVGQGGILATPAVSAVVRERERGKAFGAIVLTASHNPGGPDGDFGIKYNTEDGAPAMEALTDAVYEATTEIERYLTVEGGPDADVDTLGARSYVGGTEVVVIDPVEDYAAVLRKCFNFKKIAALLKRPDFTMVFDGMHGAGGVAARRVLGELGLDASCLLNAAPLPDFGGLHPDPNLVYAAGLVSRMGLDSSGSPTPAAANAPDFGAATDGDADRNMILGKGFFVNPSDSVAVLAANHLAIPQFCPKLRGVARSMPTSRALEKAALDLDIDSFETPTGWKFFGNLMELEVRLSFLCASLHRLFARRAIFCVCFLFDNCPPGEKLWGSRVVPGLPRASRQEGRYTPFLCGEESFGTGASHIREKDGLWAILAWLSVIAAHNPSPTAPLVGVREIVEAHWARFGRHFYSRHDYEGVDGAKAEAVMEHLRSHFAELAQRGAVGGRGLTFAELRCVNMEEFAYEDPADESLSVGHGIILGFAGGERAVFRLSGTGSAGATLRVYLEAYETRRAKLGMPAADALAKVAAAALEASRIANLTGCAAPTVIT